MITQDRIDLNDRFRVVFALLEQRGVIVKNDRKGRGMGDFAEKILGNRGYGHIISAYLNPSDKRVINYSQARTLCREFNVSEAYMLDGVGEPFDVQEQPGEYMGSLTGGSGNIRFTSFDAFAGFATDSGTVVRDTDAEFFHLPGLSGSDLVAFPISGNSMDPIIQDKDIVICKKVANLNSIQENSIYAVKSNGAVWIKYVRPLRDEQNRIVRLKLISANHLEHDPFIEDVNQHTQIYRVVKRISSL